jgi:Domain of unknown function (DUF4160)
MLLGVGARPDHARTSGTCRPSAASSGSRSRCTSTITGSPHFHARDASGQAKIRIDEVEVIESALQTRQLRLVLAWAELHQSELLENWQRARAGETLLNIEPLR